MRGRFGRLGILLALLAGVPAVAAEPPIIPRPLVETEGRGGVALNDGTPVLVPADDAEAASVARLLADYAARTGGPRLDATGGHPAAGPAIRLVRRPGLGDEGYRLDVDATGATVAATTRTGLFYGAVSLAQLLSAAPGGRVGALHVEDAPRYPWRGLVLDSVRHFQPVDEVVRTLDWMGLHKLNRLQWHLTDDQGWRIAVPGYPRLTTEAAWRSSPPAAGPAGRHGGFYTRADIARVLAAAAERGIVVVPEIEMPGHSTAAILAYPQLGLTPHTAANLGDWGIFSSIFGVGEPTFTFLHRVLDEVMAAFPGQAIAIGGDEAVHDQWHRSSVVQARMKALGLPDENALQAWFVGRIGDYLHAHGRRLAGWDEVFTGGGVPADGIVLSWHGGDTAVAAAAAGHDVVMVTEPTFYLDYRQSAGAAEPPGRDTVIRLADVYAYQPPAAARILGVQGALWTEYVAGDAGVERKALPRAAAIAEVGWTAPGRRDWTSFRARLPAMADRYRAMGLEPGEGAYALEAGLRRDNGRVAVTLERQLPIGEVRYTVDGSAPGAASPRYTAPLDLGLPVRLRAAGLVDGRPFGPPLDLMLDRVTASRRASQELELCAKAVPLDLPGRAAAAGAAGPAYRLDIRNPCWIYRDADLAGVRHLAVRVAALPFNFQFGADPAEALPPTATPAGELTVRRGCDGPLLATVPLAGVAADGREQELVATLPSGPPRADLCVALARPTPAPLWALASVELRP